MAVYQGAAYTATMTLSATSTLLPYNITGWTFAAQFRQNVTDATPLFELTIANGGFVVTNGPAGQLQMNISAANSALLPVGKVYFDVLRTDAVPGPVWAFGGHVCVKQPVTRAPL